MLVSALVVLLVGALWYQVVYSPMESKASKAKAAARDANATVANLRQDLAGATGPTKKKSDVEAKTLNLAIPADAAEADFLRNLDALNVTSGVAFQSVSPTAPIVSGDMATISIGLTAQGTEAQLLNYLAGLYDMKRILVVDNASFAQGGATGSPGAGGTSAGTTTGHPGSAFTGDLMQIQVSGRIFAQASALAPAAGTSSSRSASTPATGAPAPTGGATSPPGVQNG
jgi:Tfp pilus assembly protein PilO